MIEQSNLRTVWTKSFELEGDYLYPLVKELRSGKW